MKGKNNRAPIDEYMGGVLGFIRQKKLKTGHNAQSDFENAGYFSIEDQLYTRAEAIEKFLRKEPLGNVGDKKLVKISFSSDMAKLMISAYPTFSNELKIIGERENEQDAYEVAIYELRDGTGHAGIAGLVVGNELTNINRAERQADAPAVTEGVNNQQGSETLELVKELFKRKIITRVGKNVDEDVFWNDGMAFNEKGDLVKTEHDTVKHSKKGHTWNHHTKEHEVSAAHSQFADDPTHSYYTKDTGLSKHPEDDIHSYYITKHKPKDEKKHKRGHIAAMRTHGGDYGATLMPRRLQKIAGGNQGFNDSGDVAIIKKPNMSGHRPGSAGHKGGTKDHKTIKSLMDLANTENLNLPGNFKVNAGITTDEDGKHSMYVPTPIAMDTEGKEKKYNLSSIEDETEKAVAFNAIAQSLDVRPWREPAHEDVPQPDHRANDMGAHKQEGGYSGAGQMRVNGWNDDSSDVDHSQTSQHLQKHEKDDGRSYSEMRKYPDDIYTIRTKYGADKKYDIMLMAIDDEIYGIDGDTRMNQFQHWGDHEEIADTINKFAADHGLKIKRRFLNRLNSSELRNGAGGTITTASKMVTKRLEKLHAEGGAGREGTDTLPLANGSKVVKLTSVEQTDWLRNTLGLNSVPGQAWKIQDEDGNVKGAFFVKNDKIMAVYDQFDEVDDPEGQALANNPDGYRRRKQPDPSRNLPQYKGSGYKMMPEIKGAMKAFNWEMSPAAHFKIDTELRSPINRLETMARRLPSGFVFGTTPGSNIDVVTRKLLDMGFVDEITSTRRKRTYKINAKGRAYYNDLKPQSSKMHSRWDTLTPSHNDKTNPPTAHLKHFGDAVEVQSDYIVPERTPKPEPKRTVRPRPTPASAGASTNVPRAGTKSSQALDLFRQHVTDHDEMPARSDFINILQDEPFNMSKAGASTYYANTKKKYSALNEKYSVLAALELMVEGYIFLEDWI